jgi:hypothetical protein
MEPKRNQVSLKYGFFYSRLVSFSCGLDYERHELIVGKVSFALTLIIPLGCMSPSTQNFALFSVNPRVLAHRYANTTAGREHLNATLVSGKTTLNGTTPRNGTVYTAYSPAFDADLLVLPNVYRVGMSGVCREYFNGSMSRCTKTFPQLLDLGTLIERDIQASILPNKTSDELQTFFNSLLRSEDQRVFQQRSLYASFIKASVGFTVLSLIVAPLGIAGITTAYIMKRDIYTTVAASVAIFDAFLVIIAAALWIAASVSYMSDLDAALGPAPSTDPTTFWGATQLYPLSLGLYLFAIAALAKLLVLPIVALITICLLLIVIVISVLIAWMILVCLCTCLADDDRVVYYYY